MSNYKFAPKFKSTTPFRPMPNVGALMDIQTGKYFVGMQGESILNGGVAQIEGYTGPGNSMKSTLMWFRLLMVFLRYEMSTGFAYDTENSANLPRLMALANEIDPTGALAASLDEEIERFSLTSAEVYGGTKWFHEFKNHCKNREKEDKKWDTPFKGQDGNPIKAYTPIVGAVDSFSQFRTDAVQTKADKGDIGESDLNTLAMQNANGKAQVMDELPILAGKSGISVMLSAHMGDVIVMDQYNGPKKKLWGVKANRKMKKVPESFTFLTNNLFEIIDLKPLFNKTTGGSEYPLNPDDDMKGNTDLMCVTIMPIRTKYGITGIPFELLISQTHGVQATLSEFWYCKNYDRFGIGGNLVHMELDLYPGVKFTRNNIRQLIKSDPKFCRAMQITSDLCQMRNLWGQYAYENIKFTPKELYDKLKADGYDWDVLLNTRTYWTYDQYTHPVPFLSTKDLINMHNGSYRPYWM